MNNQFSTFPSINGDMVVGFTSSKSVKDLKWFDAPKVSAYLLNDENSHKKHLGMVNLYATTHKRPMTFMRNLFEKSAVLEVTPTESITYDLPVHRENACATVTEDTSTLTARPGQGETIFELILSEEFQPGDVLTYDPLFGEQCHVADIPVEPVGDGFRHYCQISSLDKEKFFPPEKLKPGTSYMKVTNIMPELGVNYSGINLIDNPIGTITCEFILGDHRSVETFYTDKAARMKAPGLKSVTDATKEKAMRQLENMIGDNKDMYFMTKIVKDAQTGKTGFSPNASDLRVGPAVEYFVLAELVQMEAQSLVMAKAGVFRTGNGGTKMINEGAWHQYRRGKIIRYAKEGGLTLDHLHNAASYVFKNSDMPVHERELGLDVGSRMHAEIEHLFREETTQQLNGLAGLLGTTTRIESPLSGSLGALDMDAVRFRSVKIPGIGKIKATLDDTLDYQPLVDKLSRGFYGDNGYAWTSHSAIIRDASSPAYSNVAKSVKNATLVEGGTVNSNIYYIKPEGAHVTFGYEQGRMANDGNASYVQSSLKAMGRTFWAHSSSACLVLDVSRQVTIELQR